MAEAAQRLVPEPMSRRESIYLDLVRSVASLLVVLDHAPALFKLPGVPRWGYQSVMAFFVLSGYVISHVADTRETTLRVFIVARLARLWSVLVPAVALTIVCDAVGREFGYYQASYTFAPIDLPLVRIGAVLAFMADSWVSIQPLSNSVVWSLCAEFWYYMLFAAWTFVPPGRCARSRWWLWLSSPGTRRCSCCQSGYWASHCSGLGRCAGWSFPPMSRSASAAFSPLPSCSRCAPTTLP